MQVTPPNSVDRIFHHWEYDFKFIGKPDEFDMVGDMTTRVGMGSGGSTNVDPVGVRDGRDRVGGGNGETATSHRAAVGN